MNFNSHLELAGKHAFLSASKYHWVNYDPVRLDEVYRNSLLAKRGTELHALAFELIRLGVKLPKTQKTLNMYVNDALGFRMRAEQILYYSDNAYGTADTISFRRDHLRIHDLKTGVNEASMIQLEIYAAYFCLEYGVKPSKISMELRIYQNDEVIAHTPPADDILRIMEKIVTFDHRIEQLKVEGGYSE